MAGGGDVVRAWAGERESSRLGPGGPMAERREGGGVFEA